MATIEDIKRRVRALIAKKNGGTEAEIASALALAKKLMGEWALTEVDCAAPAEAGHGFVRASTKPRSYVPVWECSMGIICEELFSVKAYSDGVTTPGKTKVMFCGSPVDVDLSLELYTILKAQVMELGRLHVKMTGCSYAERSRFCYGVVTRLLDNIREAQQAAKAEDDERCRGLVLAKKEMVREWLKTVARLEKPDTMIVQDGHFEMGRRAAERVDMGMRQKVR